MAGRAAAGYRRTMRFIAPVLISISLAAPSARAEVLPAAEPPAAVEAPPAVPARPCSTAWRWLFPGLGTICAGQTTEGTLIAGAAAVDLGASIATGGHPVPVTLFAETYIYGLLAPTFELDRAAGVPFTPPERTGDLLAAPFRPSVLARTDVWAAILVSASVGITASRLSGLTEDNRRDDPIVFGREYEPEVGYPLAGAAIGGLHLHVAVTEESFFRGYLQSSLARNVGEGAGWGMASVAFGASHALNLTTIPSEKRALYAAAFLPYVTLAGGYLGYLYKRTGYSLSAPVAVHFWNNLLTGIAEFVLDPENTPISASISLPF
jgi:membrane protease YdiL (CAAX protease family)